MTMIAAHTRQGRVSLRGHRGQPGRPRRLCGDGDANVVFASRRRGHDDGGYTLALTALMLVPLMFFVAIAIDLGAWLAQAAKLQRSADAAAMAAVVWMPQTATAQAAATAAARANGYVSGGGVTVTAVPGAQETDYQVTISAPAPRFFSQVVGLRTFNVTRSAVARYNNPIPMGSPVNQFGNDPTGCTNKQPGSPAGCGISSMVWTALNGPYAGRASGDPYSVKCNGDGSNTYTGSAGTCAVGANSNGAQNPAYKPDGYSFAVDVAAVDVGRPLKLQIYDAAQIERSTSGDCGGTVSSFLNCQAGDWANSGSGASPAPLEASLYENDGTSAITYGAVVTPKDNTVASLPEGAPSGSKCHLYVPANASASTFKNNWVNVCQFTPTQKGIYPFRVRSSGGPRPIKDYSGSDVTDTGSGINAFSLRVTGGTSTSSTRLYALDSLSVFTNTPGSAARFYLAEVPTVHRGKKLRLDLFDPGDGNDSKKYTLQVLKPPAGSPATIPTGGVATDCYYNPSPSATFPANPNTLNTGCTITTKTTTNSGTYQDGWLRVEVNIPIDYSCSTDCWWTIRYDFNAPGSGSGSSSPYDRTVWSMQVVGDPVHLIQ
jgi:Flp pilus assembly protein TadG